MNHGDISLANHWHHKVQSSKVWSEDDETPRARSLAHSVHSVHSSHMIRSVPLHLAGLILKRTLEVNPMINEIGRVHTYFWRIQGWFIIGFTNLPNYA